MTEAPIAVASGSNQKARGCFQSPKLNGTLSLKPTTEPNQLNPGPRATRLNCHGCTSPGSTGPGCPGSGQRTTCSGSPDRIWTRRGGADEGNYVCRRKCGCVKTSDKLKQILQTFPNPQPPGALHTYNVDKASGLTYGQSEKSSSCRTCSKKPKEGERSAPDKPCCPVNTTLAAFVSEKEKVPSCGWKSGGSGRSWQIVTELVSLVQLSVTATALALYYLIYCYMQLVYYTLRSALYFHNADGPMKITIGVVTLTSLIVGFNILMRMEGIIGIVY